MLCGCLSLGPPSDWQSAILLQEFGALETVPALVAIRMTMWLALNDSTHSAVWLNNSVASSCLTMIVAE
jgi:hypothetical protein